MTRIWTLVLLSLLALGSLAPRVHAEPATIANDFCPVTPEEWAEADISTTYEGKSVYFCCQRCRRQFLEDPARYLEKLPQFADALADHGRAHDHAHDHGPGKEVSPSAPARAYRFAGKLHPLAVHFPIALVLVALGLEIAYLMTRRRVLSDTNRVLLPLAALGALGAALLGWAAGSHASYPGELAALLDQHRWVGVATAAATVMTAIFSELHQRGGGAKVTFGYRVTLVLAAAFIVVAGHLGGNLVFGPDHLRW